MSARTSTRKSGSNGVNAIKSVAFWGGLLIGSFLLGFLVISPLMNAAAKTREPQVDANKPVSPAPSNHAAAVPATGTERRRPTDDNDSLKITPEKPATQPDVQKAESTDKESSVTRNSSRGTDDAGTSGDSGASNEETHPSSRNREEVQPSDQTDRASRDNNSDNTEKPTRTRRKRDTSGDTSATEEPTTRRRHHNSNASETPARSTDPGTSDVQRGEGIDH